MAHKRRKRILYYSEGWGLGGIESYIMLTAASLDRGEFDFDVFCTHDWDSSHDAAIEAAGGRRFVVFEGRKPSLPVRLVASARAFRSLLASTRYDIVHINTMNGMGFIYARIAQKAGVPVRIVHSHNADFGAGSRGIKSIAHRLGKVLWSRSATARLACSQDAGVYLHDSAQFTVIRNCIDTVRFQYDECLRRQTRHALGVGEETLVFGAVGRMDQQKNPVFQVEILSSLLAHSVDAMLVLAGSGPEEGRTRQRAAELGVSDRVFFVGATTRAENFYNALDLFSMPSTFEGFGITVLEAMACGLPCLVSSNVPEYDFDSARIVREDIGNAVVWAERIREIHTKWADTDRSEGAGEIERIGYGIDAAFEQVAGFYRQAG